jgi:hypothetical protein
MSESTLKPSIHSPKVKKHRTPLHPPAERPTGPYPGPVSQSQSIVTTDDNSSQTDSVPIQSILAGDDRGGTAPTATTSTSTTATATARGFQGNVNIVVKRSKSYGDDGYVHPVSYIVT